MEFNAANAGNMSVVGRPGPQNEDEMGIKSMAHSSSKSHLAVGDMIGNIRVYQLTADITSINQVTFIEAHEGKVTALQYSQPYLSQTFLISGSSDRMLHIFNASNDDYDLIQTIDAH